MSLALSGCDDFLTKEPETNLSPNTFFSSEAELELWTNRFYSLFAGPDTDAIQVSDIQICLLYTSFDAVFDQETAR